MITLKTPAEIEAMREGGKRLAAILETLKKETKAGIMTNYLDTLGSELIRESGGRPAFLGYRPSGSSKPYPATICVSVNDVVVHGMPSLYVIKEGDIVKLDLGLMYEGLYVDAAVSVAVGEIPKEARVLLQKTEEALYTAIKEARLRNTLGDIGFAVSEVVHMTPFSIVKSLTGHGIGRELHEDPYVFNEGRRGQGMRLEEGMVLAIEPMVAIGSGEVKQLSDDSFVTADGSLTAHFEHTVAITKQGPEILTRM